MSPDDKPTPSQRRLAAIVFTDVASYSARMQHDETGTLTLVRTDFVRMRLLCARYGGEVLKSTGDGLLLSFDSVVQAVTCALQIQKEFSTRPATALQHRIGIHLGDVFREGGDVAGDGVNIAARLQTKARPGTVCLSQSVYDAVKGKVPLQSEALGPQSFKNITEPITVYLATPSGSLPAPSGARKSRLGFQVGVVLAIAAGLAVVYWSKPPARQNTAKSPDPATNMAEADRSIAVLPFTNMSDDKENAFFADGVHEDILTNLANITALKVISRTSMLQYRGTTKTIRQIGAELGVAYVLEGSVRRAGNKVRVTGQLIRTATDEHLWAKNYDLDLTDIFGIQAEVAREIAQSLHAVITPQENARLDTRPTTNAAAYVAYLQGRLTLERAVNAREMLDTALPLMERAVQLDPAFAAAWASIGLIHLQIAASGDKSETRMQLARAALTEAEKINPDDHQVLRVGATLGAITRDRELVNRRRRRIIELFPGQAESQLAIALNASYEGNWSESMEALRKGLERDPRNTDIMANFADLLVGLRRYPEADRVLRSLVALDPESIGPQILLAELPFFSRGDTTALKTLLGLLPVEPDAEDLHYHTLRSRILYRLGEPGPIVQFWEKAGLRWRSDEVGRDFGGMVVVAAYLAQNNTAAARTLLLQEKETFESLRAKQDGRLGPIALNQYGRILALLGDTEAARKTLAETRLLIKNRPGTSAIGRIAVLYHNALFRTLVGEKAEGLAELKVLMREPFGPNVHSLRSHWGGQSLRRDPEFEALLNDPANNAPLL